MTTEEKSITKLSYFEGVIYNDEKPHFFEWNGVAEDKAHAQQIMIIQCARVNATWTPSSDWKVEVRPFRSSS